MKTPVLTLILLIIVGVIGYFALTNQNKAPSPQKNIATNSQPTNAATNTSATTTEVSQGLTVTITSPANKSTVGSPALKVMGKTSPNADVFVNDNQSKADSTGAFLANVNLDEGENVITVTVNDDKGNYAEKELTVFLESTQ